MMIYQIYLAFNFILQFAATWWPLPQIFNSTKVKSFLSWNGMVRIENINRHAKKRNTENWKGKITSYFSVMTDRRVNNVYISLDSIFWTKYVEIPDVIMAISNIKHHNFLPFHSIASCWRCHPFRPILRLVSSVTSIFRPLAFYRKTSKTDIETSVLYLPHDIINMDEVNFPQI